SRVRRHAVEVTTAKIHQLAFTGARRISDLVLVHSRRFQRHLIAFANHLPQVTPADALVVQSQHAHVPISTIPHQRKLDGTRTHVDARGEDALFGRSLHAAFLPAAARCANNAAPRAPV